MPAMWQALPRPMLVMKQTNRTTVRYQSYSSCPLADRTRSSCRWRPARQTRSMMTTAANAPMVLGVVTPAERRGNRTAMYAAMTRIPPPTTSHVPTRSDQSSRDRSGRAAHKLAWPSTLRPNSHTMISLRSEVGQDHRERSCPARRYPPSELA